MKNRNNAQNPAGDPHPRRFLKSFDTICIRFDPQRATTYTKSVSAEFSMANRPCVWQLCGRIS
jgi:hypothetical protein